MMSSGYIYEDHAFGKRDDRPGLEACVKPVRSGDTLIAWKLNRLGRDLRHLVSLMQELTGRGVGLRLPAGEGGLCWKLGDAVIRRRSVLTCWRPRRRCGT
jgi:DNA invertase Pin-like site-specific DNA recombinase